MIWILATLCSIVVATITFLLRKRLTDKIYLFVGLLIGEIATIIAVFTFIQPLYPPKNAAKINHLHATYSSNYRCLFETNNMSLHEKADSLKVQVVLENVSGQMLKEIRIDIFTYQLDFDSAFYIYRPLPFETHVLQINRPFLEHLDSIVIPSVYGNISNRAWAFAPKGYFEHKNSSKVTNEISTGDMKPWCFARSIYDLSKQMRKYREDGVGVRASVDNFVGFNGMLTRIFISYLLNGKLHSTLYINGLYYPVKSDILQGTKLCKAYFPVVYDYLGYSNVTFVSNESIRSARLFSSFDNVEYFECAPPDTNAVWSSVIAASTSSKEINAPPGAFWVYVFQR